MDVRSVRFHEGAAYDVKNALSWYDERNPEVANDFLEELSRAVETIANAPQRWPLGANNTRRFLLWRFPFAVIYSEEESVVTVWAVAHGSRRPEYWSGRLESRE